MTTCRCGHEISTHISTAGLMVACVCGCPEWRPLEIIDLITLLGRDEP